MRINDRMRRFVMTWPVLAKRRKRDHLGTTCPCGTEIEIGDEIVTKRVSGSYQYRAIYHVDCAKVRNLI